MRLDPPPLSAFQELTRESILFNPFGEKRSTWEVVVGVPHQGASGEHLALMEQLIALHADEFRDFDWRDLWAFVSKSNKRDKIPPYGKPPYWRVWQGAEYPVSILAFWPASSRLRLASDPTTDLEHRGWLRADPEPEIRRVSA